MEQNETLNAASAHVDGPHCSIASSPKAPFSALQNRLDLCHSELAGAIRRGVGKTEGSILIAALTDAITRFDQLKQARSRRPYYTFYSYP